VTTEVASRADLTIIRYAQCWEDADVLLGGLAIQPDDDCIAIASAGDNALAMLTAHPRRVVALDLNPAQLACVRLRVAAYRTLDHDELLELIGARPSDRRPTLYARCRREIDDRQARRFWDEHSAEIVAGIGAAGRFERYFKACRTRILPLVHSRKRVAALLEGGDAATRRAFYDERWNTWRWRALFRVFFSRFVMGRLGRDPSFFRYADEKLSDHLMRRVEHALTALDPADNPYLHWILTGTHGAALPLALRAEHFETIRANLDRLEIVPASLEAYLDDAGTRFDRFNLSDIFEYMSDANAAALLGRIADHANPGARLAYWNMLVERSRPEEMADRLQPLPDLAQELHDADRAFFYRAFVVEEVLG